MGSTIIDVAKLCGFSKATVSRAFTNPAQVSEDTRNKIYEAARALNYAPNAIARAMVRKKTDNIAFIIHEKQYPVILNPFYAPIVESILKETNRLGYSLFIAPDRDIRLPSGEIYMKKHMDGVIIAGHTDENVILSLKKQSIPVILLNNYLELNNLYCIISDEYNGAVSAMEHLISRGHKKIGLLSGKFSSFVYYKRYNAYMDTLKKYGLQPDYRFIQTIEPTMEKASEAVKTMMSLDNPPTALFCTNDTLAIGAVKTALRKGIRVPEDLAVVGHDDSNICRCIEPELTTVHVDKENMGKIAVKILIQLINGEVPKQTVTTTRTKMIIRGTT